MSAPVSDRAAGFLSVFALVFPIVYTLAYYNEWAVFRFYPLVGEVHWTPQPTLLGPAMIYYGWIALAAGVALAAALVVPARLACRIWPGWTWLLPLAATFVTFAYETRWFLH